MTLSSGHGAEQKQKQTTNLYFFLFRDIYVTVHLILVVGLLQDSVLYGLFPVNVGWILQKCLWLQNSILKTQSYDWK
nr:hypothetical protein CFP56_15015 [Quercus suber]